MEEYLQEVVNAGLLKASTTPEISDAYFMVDSHSDLKATRTGYLIRFEHATRSVLHLFEGRKIYM